MFEKLLAYISLRRKGKPPVEIYDIHKMPEQPSFEELIEALGHLRVSGYEPSVRDRVWASVTTACPNIGSLISEWNVVGIAVRHRESSSDDKDNKYYADYAPWVFNVPKVLSVDDFLTHDNGSDMAYQAGIDFLYRALTGIWSELSLEHNSVWKRYYVAKTSALRAITAAVIRQLASRS